MHLSLLHFPTPSLPPSLPFYTTIHLSFQFFSLFPATVLSPSHYSLRRIHSVSTRSHHPSPFLSIFPPHISVGALLFAREGACCYWFLSGDVGGTSVDAISDSVALFMLQPSKSSQPGKRDRWRMGPKENKSIFLSRTDGVWDREGRTRTDFLGFGNTAILVLYVKVVVEEI